MKFLESSKAMFQLTYGIANLPARISLIDSSKYANNGVEPWIESLRSKNVRVMPDTPWIAQYLNDINTEISNVLLLDETPLQAPQKIAIEAKQYAG